MSAVFLYVRFPEAAGAGKDTRKRRVKYEAVQYSDQKKEEFVPIEEGKVRMYVCGPTVYNFIHIGNARPMIVFDTARGIWNIRAMKSIMCPIYRCGR